MSGFEIAGIVLAVLPLCITALEHYEDEIKPFKALFNYETELSESKREMYFVHASFTKTIQNLCHDASVADTEQLEEMRKGSSAGIWLDIDAEHKLEQYLSRQGYDAYKFKTATICGNLVDVAKILGLDENSLLKAEGMQGFRTDPWIGVAAARSTVQTAFTPSKPKAVTQSTYRTLKKRVRFILRGGSLGSLVQKIAEGTQQLDRLIEKSSRPHTVPIRPTQIKPKEPFSRPLTDIEDHACRLHRALAGVWLCPDHQSHCVNLKLETRLRKEGAQRGIDDHASFTIALMRSQIWRSMEVTVCDEPPSRPKRSVGFQLPSTTSTQALLLQMIVVEDLYHHAHGGVACMPLSLDHQDKLLRDGPTATPILARSTANSTVTLRELLTASKRSEITAKQSMKLALTLVSSFLQLRSTPWLQEPWCAQDVILLRSNTKLDVECPFISQIYPPAVCSTTNRLSDSDRIFALGTILLQIVTQTPIEDRRTAANATLEDPSIMRSYLHDDAVDWLDCFADSIAACLKFYYGRFDLDLNDQATRMEVIEAVLYPFQRDLRW